MTTKTVGPAEKSHQKLVKAREILRDRKAELTSIANEIESVERAWQTGDDAIPSSRMTGLKEEQNRLTSLVSAAESGVKTAERLLLIDNPELAEAVAAALGTSFHGIKAQAVTKLPKVDDGDLLPHLFVVQPKPHQDLGDGSISGECSLHLIGPAWTIRLNEGTIERTLKAGGVRWKDRLHAANNRIDLSVTAAQPAVPTIHRVPNQGASVSVSGIVIAVERGSLDGHGTALAHASQPSGEIVSVKVDASGIRTTVVQTDLTIRNNPRGYWTADQAIEHAKRELTNLTGDCLNVLGRVTNVEHLTVAPTGPGLYTGPGRCLTSRFTLVSKVRPAN